MCEDGWRLGVDIGGTFTDFQLMNAWSGEVVALKTPSTPEDPSLAVARGLEDITRRHGIDPAAIRYFAHGTTLAVNTLLERKGACTGVLMTRGFTDTLELRRLRLSKANDFFVPRPVPLVPRRLVRPIDERLKSDGEVIRPPCREDVEEQVRALLEDGVETIAVCFLHAYRNPHHEQLARQWITESFPEIYVTISTDVWPQQREYERALVSVINAYVGSRMESYFNTLEKRTQDLAMPCRVFSTKSNGGVMTAASAARRPVETLLSGPASGVIGARHVASTVGDDHVVTLDMGGTSVDVSIIQGAIGQATDNTIGDIPVIMPAVDVSAVGAGGGSIAWTDSEGVLKVGPRSAGALPGPACYGRGGTEPTVTDAYLVAGIIAEDSLLDGTMVLDHARAHAAIDQLAAVIGRTRSETADAILQVTTANIYAQLLPLTARRESTPRGFPCWPMAPPVRRRPSCWRANSTCAGSSCHPPPGRCAPLGASSRTFVPTSSRACGVISMPSRTGILATLMPFSKMRPAPGWRSRTPGWRTSMSCVRRISAISVSPTRSTCRFRMSRNCRRKT